MTSSVQHPPRTFAVPNNPAWVPDGARVERSRLLQAMRRWGFESLDALQAAAVRDPEWFWTAVADDLNVDFETPFDQVLDETRGKPFPTWFVGGKINAATLCALRHADGPLAGKHAIVYEGDNGQRRTATYAELSADVRRFAANLTKLGIEPGDRVVLFLPVVPEAVVAFLACAMIGAVSVPAFTGYGAEALASRIRESEAVAVVTADGTTRRGKFVAMKATADEALESSPTVQTVFVVRHQDASVPMKAGRDHYWDELDESPTPVSVQATGANEPLTIIYTSGTTGAPKGIVHSHAGFSIKAATDFAYGFDIHEGDVIAWIADMGWMLGPLMIMGGLQLGATIVLTEGVPDHPTPNRLWDIAARNKVTVQGIAPTAARALLNAGSTPGESLATVHSFASTGEAWDAPTWTWLFNDIGDRQRPIVNYTGGTETGGGILISYPFLPSDAAAFNGPLPGMEVVVADVDGNSVAGEIGELAIRNTWPGMTHAFWRDDARYLETYWARWPGTWIHGDLASVTTEGTWHIHGCSDDTIKVSGRRVGPAEIEAALLKDPRISEAAVVGVPDPARGQRVVAFVVLRAGVTDDADVRLKAVENAGKSFAPTLFFVASLPKTKNGKIMRRAIRARHLSSPPGDLSALDPMTPLEDIPVEQKPGEQK